MLSNQEFDDWYDSLNLPQAARKIIEQIRSTEPIRRVNSSGINVRGDYASSKMKKTIQFESHKVELPGIEEYEEDSEVLEYYDQPYQFTLEFLSNSGQIVRASHIPDFFVIRNKSAGFEEWKPETRLEKLAAKQPQRYSRTEDGQWHNLPACVYAEQLGLYYRIRLDTEIDWIKYRNRLFLKAYTQSKYQVSSEIVEEIVQLVASQPGITYWELLSEKSATSDDINALIATQKIYINLSAAPLAEPERVHLFLNKETAVAYAQMVNSLSLNITPIAPEAIGREGQKTEVANSLPSKSRISEQAMECFLKASPEALAEANRRYQIIEPLLKGNKLQNQTVPVRTVRRWKTNFITAQQKYNCGYVGLLDHHIAKGNRQPRISQ